MSEAAAVLFFIYVGDGPQKKRTEETSPGTQEQAVSYVSMHWHSTNLLKTAAFQLELCKNTFLLRVRWRSRNLLKTAAFQLELCIYMFLSVQCLLLSKTL